MITLLTTPGIRLMGAARLDGMQRVGEGWEWKEREKERARGDFFFFFLRERAEQEGRLKFFLGPKLGRKMGDGSRRRGLKKWQERDLWERRNGRLKLSWGGVWSFGPGKISACFTYLISVCFILFLVNFCSCLVLIIWIARHMMR